MSGYFQGLSQPFVIAEIGVNHNGDVELAKQMVLAAKEAGANVVKFQSFSADSVACRSALSAPHVDKALGFEGSFYELLEKLALSHDDQRTLNSFCHDLGIPFVSTPFSFEDIDFLAELDVPFLKIGSTDTHHLKFLRRAAKTGKPIVLSTGMATMDETTDAVDALLSAGCEDIALLHCVSLYPPEPAEVNLKAITTLRRAFPDLAVGFSDHTLGTWACVAAAALGAKIIEKHFTLDKTMAGPDQAVSADPADLRRIIEESRQVVEALGSGMKQPSEREAGMKKAFRRSIVTRDAVPKGTLIERAHVDFKRPGTGVDPNDLDRLIGKAVATDIPADTPIEWAMIETAHVPS